MLFAGSVIEGIKNLTQDFENGTLGLELPEDTSQLSKTKQLVVEKFQYLSKKYSEDDT